MKHELYRTSISDARWYAYDVPDNLGWIAYLAGLIRIAVKRPAFLEIPAVSVLVICAVVPALLMLTGIGELIHERIRKQDRILPKWQLHLGFGALMLGGLTGMLLSAAAIVICISNSMKPGACGELLAMTLGGLFCFVFAGLLFRGYKRQRPEGETMTIHEFGKDNPRTVVLIHPSLVRWDYFEYVIPLMEQNCHLVIPALPGYDPDLQSDFTSIEEIADELADWLLANGHPEIDCIYGCSMGGSIVIRFLSDGRVKARSAVIDGGITPYQLPWIATRFIALRDYLMIAMGKLGGIKLLEKAFATDEYSAEDLQYIADVLHSISRKTIWRTFDSCNNYSMPEPVEIACVHIKYWYAQAEAKERSWDIAYVKKHIPQATFRELAGVGHGGLAALQPERLAAELESMML